MLAVLRGKPTLVLCMSMWWTRREGGKGKWTTWASFKVWMLKYVEPYMIRKKMCAASKRKKRQCRSVADCKSIMSESLANAASNACSCSEVYIYSYVIMCIYFTSTYIHTYIWRWNCTATTLHGKLRIIIRDLSVSFLWLETVGSISIW